MPVKGVRPQVACEQCSKPFLTWPSRIKPGRPSFCSRDCANEWQRRSKVERVCGACSKKFMAQACYVNRGQYQFCSVECRKKSRFTAMEDRFKQNLGPATESGCLPWVGHTNKDGYGIISRGGRQGPLVLAHRFAYEQANGSIPDGLNVLHSCDHPPCCEPSHLFLGTQTANMADMDKKGRRKAASGEHHGHAKLTEAAVREIRERRERDGTVYKILAADYGVSITTVRQIFNGRSWRHVTRQ